MFNFMFPMLALNTISDSYTNPDYSNLTEEEKKDLEFVDSCLFGENERISEAAGYMQLFILELSVEPDKYEPEAIHERMEEINSKLTEEEKAIIDKFTLACIKSIGVLSKERGNTRKLEMKGMNNNE